MRCAAYIAMFVFAWRAAAQDLPQLEKRRQLIGESFERQLENRDARLNDAQIADYIQRMENHIAAANGLKPPAIRITRGSDQYAWLMPHGVLYISAGLLQVLNSEAELVGLLAHQLAHGQEGAVRIVSSPDATIPLMAPACVLASAFPSTSKNAESREAEARATRASVAMLKAAGYDPAGELDLLSKLAREHPRWTNAIVPEDLLAIHSTLESDAMPNGGYRIDSSDFAAFKNRLLVELGQWTARRNPPSLRRLP